MISLAECAPCKAMRLQAESEEEFRKRFGVVNAAPPRMMGWRPYLGQAQPTATYPATGTASIVSRPYLNQVQERLLWLAGGTLFGFPVGLLANVAFKSLRRYRSEAAVFATIASGAGLLAAFLPVPSPVMNVICKISGALTGGAMADIVLPRKIMAPLPG